jgi:hypothetical protein
MMKYAEMDKMYAETIKGDKYAKDIDVYNYYAAGKAWTKAWIAKFVDKSITPEVILPYT